MNIDYILNGNKKPKIKKQVKDPLMDLFNIKPKKPAVSILGDRITKSQRRVLKTKKVISLFSDWDGDGVINGLDCQPRNKKKHGHVREINKNEEIDEYLMDRFGDDDNKWPKKVRLYHGTSADNFKKIKQEGFKSGAETGNENFDSISPRYSNKIYLTQNKGNAAYWAKNTMHPTSGKKIVIGVDVPISEYKKGLKTYKQRAFSENADPFVRDEIRDEVIIDKVQSKRFYELKEKPEVLIEKGYRSDPWTQGHWANQRERMLANYHLKKMHENGPLNKVKKIIDEE